MSPAARGPERVHTNLGEPDPPVDVVHEGYCVLVTRRSGAIGEDPDEGLFDFDCRLLSWWRLTIDGDLPEFVSPLWDGRSRWGGVLRLKTKDGHADGPRLPQDALELTIRRRVGAGMEERLRLTNHSQAPRTATVRLELGSTFEDTVEPPTHDRPQQGTTTATWDEANCEIRFDFADAEGELRVERGLRVRLSPSPHVGSIDVRACAPTRARPLDGAREVAMAMAVEVRLEPRESTELRLDYGSLVDGTWRWPRPVERDSGEGPISAPEAWLLDADAKRLRITSANPTLDEILDMAARDLLELRNRDLPGDDDEAWLPNAGVPSYTGVFGRDALIAGMQALPFGREPLAGSLRWLHETQGRTYDETTEEQPGRMLHELRRGPMADLHRIPQHRFYGAHTTSTLFARALAEHWLWTGDIAVVEHHLPAARRALDWAARDGDRDGDGFMEYAATARAGLKNEAWKDSSEAIRYPDGRQVENPIATVEEQAFHIWALESTAGLLVATGDDAEADELLRRARTLRRRWHEAFWMEREGWYAVALDPAKEQIRTIASNGAHGLGVGVVPVDLAERVVRRLLAPDLFTGWGIRTLSNEHPSYNPLAYHLGSVWPFENAMFVAGLRAYGYDDEAEQLLTAELTAAGHFRESRLPELFGGHALDELEVPTVYPDSNITQAWTASAMASLVQTMLGLRPLAPLGALLLVRPRLPAWLPWLTLERLRVGDTHITIRFERDARGATRHEVVSQDGPLDVVRTDMDPGSGGAFSDVAVALGPGAAPGSGDSRTLRAVLTILLGRPEGDGEGDRG